jgi:hypothetical protein
VIDHHVDRPGVEARQRAELTGPNRPIGSNIPHPAQQQPTLQDRQNTACTNTKPEPHPHRTMILFGSDDLVAMAE